MEGEAEVRELGRVWVGFEKLAGPAAAFASIETAIWGDARAKHTYVVVQPAPHAAADASEPVWRRLEIIRGREATTIVADDLPVAPVEGAALLLVGWTAMTLSELNEAVDQLRENHLRYDAFRNNCRTFVDHLLPIVCNAGHTWPDGEASALEWIHAQKKAEARSKPK